MFRPEGWPKSPCDGCQYKDGIMASRKEKAALWGQPLPTECTCLEGTRWEASEAGADAMLMALYKQEIAFYENGKIVGITTDIKPYNGVVIYIPSEEGKRV